MGLRIVSKGESAECLRSSWIVASSSLSCSTFVSVSSATLRVTSDTLHPCKCPRTIKDQKITQCFFFLLLICIL